MAKKIQINITHIVNPSQFYFVKYDAFLNNDSDIELNYNLQKYFRQNSVGPKAYSPKVNEFVAVFNISEKHWVRAVVDHVYNFSSTEPKYILWAIDYGKPIVSNGSHIRPLPVSFQNNSSNTFFGGIINLLPAEMGFDYMEMTPQIESCNKWSSKSCEMLEKFKENSEQCFFIIEKIYQGQYFGQLEIVDCLNKKFKLNQILCKANLALVCQESEFIEKVNRLNLNKTSRWLSANGVCKLLSYQNNYLTDIENNLNLAPLTELDSAQNVSQKTSDKDQISSSFKIKEWHERNKRLITSENNSDNFKICHSEEEDSLSNLDSVSVAGAQSKLENLRNMKLSEDDQNSEYGCKFKLCGSNSKIRAECSIPIADDSFSLVSNMGRLKLDGKLTEFNSSAAIGISDEVKSTTSDISSNSYEKYKAQRQKALFCLTSENTIKNKTSNENQSVISDSSTTSQKRYLADRRSRVLGKIPEKLNNREISNHETRLIPDSVSITSQENILDEKEMKSKIVHNDEKKNLFNDTSQSIVSDSSTTSKELLCLTSENTIKNKTTSENQSVISDYSTPSQKRYLADRRNRLLGKIPQKLNSREILNYETRLIPDSVSITSQENILDEKEMKSKIVHKDETKIVFNDTSQSIVSDSSTTSKELLCLTSEKTMKNRPTDENKSIISDCSTNSQKRYLADRRNRLLGKIPQKLNSREILNYETRLIPDSVSITSQENILDEKEMKSKIVHKDETKIVFNDTSQSIVSDSSITSKELLCLTSEKTMKNRPTDENKSIISDCSTNSQKRYLADRRNRLLGKIPQKLNSREILNYEAQENILDKQEMKSKIIHNKMGSDSKDVSLKLPIEQEISMIENTKSLNSILQSDISDISIKSREKCLEQRKRVKQMEATNSGSNTISDGNILAKNQDAIYSHQVVATKPKELKSETLQNNLSKTIDENTRSNNKIKSAPTLPLAITNSKVSINDSTSFQSDTPSLVSKKSESKQKNYQLKENNQRISLPAGYNLKSIQSFKQENQTTKQKKNSQQEKRSLTKHQNLMNNNIKRNELNYSRNGNNVSANHQNIMNNNIKRNELHYSRNCNNNRTKLEEINEVCLSDVSDYSKNLVLVHGAQICKPIYKLEKAEFSDIAYKGMQQLSDSSVYRIQQYSWKHILEGNSLLLINRPQTGKSYSYLPAICSLIHMEKEDHEVENDRGPICIIIAPTRNDAVNLKYKCKNFICNGKYNDHIAFFANAENENDFKQTLADLFVGKDVLICTPQCLYRLFSQDAKLNNNEKQEPYVKWLSRDRLRHLVIENYDLWNNEKRQILAKCIKKLKLKCEENIQMVVTSNLWEPSLESFFKLRTFKNPLLCIGAHIEAAVYSGAHFNLKIVSNLKKVDCIRRFITKYSQERLVIVCTTDEESNYVWEELKKYFLCNKLTYENSSEEIENYSRRWRNSNIHENELLICSDEQLSLLRIQNAKNLVHYSLSNSWSKFSLRFSVLLNSYIDRVRLNFEPTNAKSPNTLILLDEHNDDQLPKLINFLERIRCEVPSNIKELSVKKQQEIESRMNAAHYKICTKFLEFGKYHEKGNCNIGRHVLNKNDESYSEIPEMGIIRYDVINIFSPVHYAVRILKYKSSENSNWRDYNKASKYVVFCTNFSRHFSNSANHIIHHPPKLHDVCVIADDNNFYRAQIIRVIKSPPNSLKKIDDVECKLLDEGRIEIYPISCLLSLPNEFEEFPYQAIDLRLTGVISADEEDEWDEKLNKTIKEWFKNRELSKITYFTSQIDFTILNTLFVPEIVLSEKCSENITIHRVFVKKSLIKKNLVFRNTSVTDNLKAMALSLKILRQSKQEEDTNDIHLNNPIQDLNNEKVLKNNESKKTEKEIVKMKFESSSDSKSRPNNVICPVTNFSGTPMSGHRARPIRGLRKTSLKTKETWCNLVRDQYTEVVCSSYYKPDEFYVSIKEGEHKNKRNELNKKIDSYIAEGPENITHPEVGTNCIGKFRREYERCKIVEICYDPNLKHINTKVFFVDIGFTASRSINNLYLSTKEIVEYLPYQAIKCKLIGGIWHENYSDIIYDEILERCERLFIHPISHEEFKDNIVNNICYNVVLIDCTTTTDVVINKKLIELGYGKEDEKTRHFMEIEKNNEQSNSDSEENWDDENSGQVFEYQPPKDESNFNFFNDEDDEERVFDVNFNEDELKEFMGLPKTAKFLLVDNDNNDMLNKNKKLHSEKQPQEKSCAMNFQNKSILSKEEEIENVMKEKVNKKNESDMPKLMYNTNRPFVIWQQSVDFIRLTIAAPDIDDYQLNITKNHLHFSTFVKSELKQLCIQFFGFIRPECTFHQIRGLNVVVVLLKAMNDKRFLWPRLTEINERNVLLKYDSNAIADFEFETEQVDLPVMKNYESSDDSEFGSDDFFTGDQIYNEEDDHDPFADGF